MSQLLILISKVDVVKHNCLYFVWHLISNFLFICIIGKSMWENGGNAASQSSVPFVGDAAGDKYVHTTCRRANWMLTSNTLSLLFYVSLHGLWWCLAPQYVRALFFVSAVGIHTRYNLAGKSGYPVTVKNMVSDTTLFILRLFQVHATMKWYSSNRTDHWLVKLAALPSFIIWYHMIPGIQQQL